jgi:predicted O-methyltransferase YrrM
LDSIYVIICDLKPNIIVETGVANGASSFYILLALKRNKKVIFTQLISLIWILRQ